MDSVNYNIMPDIFEVELPNGQIVEIESDSTPTGDQLNSLLTEVLPKYRVERPKSKAGESPSASELSEGIFDTFPFNTRESRVARGATPTAIKNTKFYEAFKAAKIGESVVDDESKNTVIKTSDDEFVSPTVESSKYKEQTATESAFRAGTAALGPTAAALAAGSRAAAALPVPPWVKVGGALVAGGATAIGTRLAQDKIVDAINPEQNQLLQAGYETNPTASFLGELAANAPFMRPGLSPESVRSTIRNVVGGGALGGAVQAGTEIATAPGDELMREGAAKRIALAAAAEGVFNRPTKLGEGIGIGRVGKSLKKPAPKAPAEPAAPATPTLVTQIDSGVAPSTIAEGNTASEIAGSKDLIRMLGTPDASGRSDPRSVMERLVNPASAETPKSAAESARTLDLPSRRAAESAVVFEDLPVDPIKDPISTSLIKSREIVMKEIEDFIGPMKPTSASEASNLLDLASQKTSNIKTQAMQRAVGRQQAEQINAAIEKVIGVKDPLTFTAQETELAKRLAAADVNYAGVEGQAPVLRDFLGQDVVYNGYTGRLTQSDDGKIVVTFPFRRKGGAQEIVVEGASSFDDVAKSLGVYPKNPIEIPQALPASSADAAPTGVSGAAARAASVVNPIQPIASRVDEVPQSTLSKIEETMESRPVENELEIRQRRLEQTKESLGSRYSAMEKEARAVKRTAKNSFGYEKLNEISKKYGVSISEVLDSVDINRGLGASSGASADAQAKGIISSEAGGINPTLLVDAGSTFIGATLGYQVGDTQEERLRNAAIGAAIGAGGRVGAKALTKAIKSSPKVVSAIKAKSPEIINNLKKEFKEDAYNYLFDDTPFAPSTAAASQVPDQYDNTRILGDGIVANALREAILGIDSAIRSVSPRIYGALMRYEDNKNFITKTYQAISGRFHTAARKLITNPEDQTAYFRAVRAGDMEAINSIAQKYPQYSDDIVAAYNDSRQMLDGIYGLLGEAGRRLNYVTNYFPRSVRDYEGLKKALGQEMAGVFDNAISAYKKERNLDRELTGEEIAKVINQTLGGTFAAGKKPSFMKGRSIDEITEKIEKFYDPEDVALEKYVIKAAQDINNRHWFGSAEIPSNVDGLQLEGSFGKFLAEEIQNKKLTPADQKIIIDNLQARRSMDRISSDALVPITGAMRNLTSLTMLGDATSGVAQLGDIIITVQNSGLRSGVKGTKKRLSRFLKENFGGSKRITQESDGLTLADLMLGMNTDEINQFAINNRGRIAKTTESVLKNTVGRFDRFGKEALVNSAFDQFKRAARNMDSREGRRLRSKYEEVFPEDFDAMVDDLKAGKFTDRTRLLLVTELSQMQPVLPSSMPPLYAKNPNARLIYTLKSFWARQINRIRSEGVEKIVKGYRTDNVGVMAEGLAWLGQYTALMGATGAAIDMSKDLWLGRENDPQEIAVANMMKVIGFSKYNSLEASRSGYPVAAFKWLFPLGEVVDAIFIKDLQSVVKYAKERDPTSAKTYKDLFKELESVQYIIPYAGKTLYNRFGAGKVKEEKRQYDKYLGKSQPTVGSSIINLIDPKYKPEREK